MFLAVRRASGTIFMFCALGHVFGGTEGVGSRFHVLHARSRLQRNQGYRLPFSCVALPDSISAVRRVTGPVFKFCVLRLIFGGTEGIESRFHVLRSLAHSRRYEGRRVMISSFALPDSFPGLVSGRTRF
jgi:hypothetical protein